MCIKTVGFTAIICIMVLIVVLMTSIILMFGTRLRRLKELHRDITDDDRYTSNKDAFTTLSVHRTC